MHKFMMIKKFLKKFDITTKNEGDEFVVTFSGTKEDVKKLEEKYNAIKVLHEDCCEDEKNCCK